MADGSLIEPDLLVADPEAISTARYGFLDPGHVHLVVEIASAGRTAVDRYVKPILYAQAGIPSYWRVELGEDGPTIVAFRLEDGVYVEDGRGRPGEPLAAARPFPIRLDPTALLPPIRPS